MDLHGTKINQFCRAGLDENSLSTLLAIQVAEAAPAAIPTAQGSNEISICWAIMVYLSPLFDIHSEARASPAWIVGQARAFNA
jgi:hypothetical protein